MEIKVESKSTNISKDEKNSKKYKKDLKINYLCICLFAFLTGTDFAVIIPTLWDRLHNDFQATGTFMGLVISSYSFSGVISGLIMGKLSDLAQKNKIFFMVSIFFAVLGHILYFFGINKFLILFSRALCGISVGASTVALAFIARTTTEEKRTAVISLVMASRQFGLMFGPAFNILLRRVNFYLFDKFLVDRKSMPGLFMASSWSLYLLLFVFIFKEITTELSTKENLDSENLIDISEKKQNDTSLNLKQNLSQFVRIEIFLLLGLSFFTYFNQTSLETMVTPFTEVMFGWSELENSILFCCGGIMIILSFLIIRLLSNRINDRSMILIGLSSILIGLIIACSFLPFVKKFDYLMPKNNSNQLNNQTSNYTNELINKSENKDENDTVFFGAFILFVVFDVIGLPVIAISSASLFTKLIDKSVQGFGQGIQRGILGIGSIFGPLCAGPFVYKPLVLMMITLTIIGVIFILIIIFFKKLKPTSEISDK
ncbi:unnamed protein product [Brachionus calyciflorus]|uniref:Major facilitator superfamily (MFS) profile domain-containing protein n=1 Tax=Brachionus calyciflorus TaxID=104777 RepID=A0A813QYQ1_9BILA|nr:unnamed protein product [Brachionus calyciflorus]